MEAMPVTTQRGLQSLTTGSNYFTITKKKTGLNMVQFLNDALWLKARLWANQPSRKPQTWGTNS